MFHTDATLSIRKHLFVYILADSLYCYNVTTFYNFTTIFVYNKFTMLQHFIAKMYNEISQYQNYKEVIKKSWVTPKQM